MKLPKPWPFTEYDFFSFFIPAVLFLCFLCVFWGINSPDSSLASLHSLKQLIPSSTSWVIELNVFIVAISIVYILGHCICALSSLVFDKIIVAKCFGYPYEKILNFKTPYHEIFKRRCHIFICGLPMSFPVVFIFSSFFIREYCLFLEMAVVWLVLMLLGSMLFTLGRKKGVNLNDKDRVAVILKWLAKPFSIFLHKASRLFRFHKRLSESVRDSVAGHFEECFGMKIETAGTDAFWLPWVRAYKSGGACTESIRDAWHLYSLARNMATVCLVFFFLATAAFAGSWDPRMRYFALGMLLGVFVFGSRFYYLFRNHYTKSVYRVFLNSFISNSGKTGNSLKSGQEQSVNRASDAAEREGIAEACAEGGCGN